MRHPQHWLWLEEAVQLGLMNYLAGVNEGLVVNDLQCACDPRVSVWMSSRGTSQVKDHQPLVLSSQIQEVLQAGDRLVLDLNPFICIKRRGRAERIPLREKERDRIFNFNKTFIKKKTPIRYTQKWQNHQQTYNKENQP